MDKKVWIGSIVLIVLVIIGVTYFSLYLPSKPRVKTLSNVTELYSLFTPLMQNYVSLHLNSIECYTNEYYYNNSNVCFVCYDFDACYRYAWVNRTGGQKMNYFGMYCKGGNHKTRLNFYSFGVAKLLNCECDKECICEGEIKGNVKDLESTSISVFTFPGKLDITTKVVEIANKKNLEECNIIGNVSEENYNIECGELVGIIRNNTAIFGLQVS